MPSRIEVDIDIEIKCQCGHILSYNETTKRGNTLLEVELCPSCIAEKDQEIKGKDGEIESLSEEIESLKDEIDILKNKEIFVNIIENGKSAITNKS